MEARLERLPHTVTRWLEPGRKSTSDLKLTRNVMVCRDRNERLALLFQASWDLDYFQRQNPDVQLFSISEG